MRLVLFAKTKSWIGKMSKTVQELSAELSTTIAEFQASQIEKMKSKVDDVVLNEKIAKLNESITATHKEIEDRVKAMEADHDRFVKEMARKGGGNDNLTPEIKAHKKAFFAAMRNGIDGVSNDDQAILKTLTVADFQTQIDKKGGFFVPAPLISEINRVQQIYSAMRQLADVVQISTGNEYEALVNIGGMAAVWTDELTRVQNTATPIIEKVNIKLHELQASPQATQRLLEDSEINIEKWFAQEVAIAFAETEGSAFISGSGVAKPWGILSYTTVADSGYTAAGSWGKVGYIGTGTSGDFAATNPGVALINLIYALKPAYLVNGSFIMNRATLAKVRGLVDAEGRFLWQQGLILGQPSTLLGYPVVVDDNMPNFGAGTFPIAFGDWKRAYKIVEKNGLQTLRDPYTAKPNVAFDTWKRVGGAVTMFEAYKLLKAS